VTTSTPSFNEQVGARLRQARERAKFLQSELALALDVSQTTISYWESGIRAMKVDQLSRIAGVLGVPLAALLPGEPETGNAPHAKAVQHGIERG
jgi:transcriptional regulator with XRE-family HTH domain